VPVCDLWRSITVQLPATACRAQIGRFERIVHPPEIADYWLGTHYIVELGHDRLRV
jgi:hypothetical protein